MSDSLACFIERLKDCTVSEKGCWEWNGRLDRHGYGRFGRKGGKAHRVAYRILVGTFPEKLCVLHECDNRRCINPAHLFLGTQQDNTADRHRKGRTRGAKQGEAHHCAVLTEEKVIGIIKEYAKGGVSQRRLAARYGVHQVTISEIVTGKIWTHIRER
jgi:hypothetical protein